MLVSFPTTERHRAAPAHAGSCPDPPSTQHAPGHRQSGPHCLLRPKIGHVGALTPTVPEIKTFRFQLRDSDAPHPQGSEPPRPFPGNKQKYSPESCCDWKCSLFACATWWDQLDRCEWSRRRAFSCWNAALSCTNRLQIHLIPGLCVHLGQDVQRS